MGAAFDEHQVFRIDHSPGQGGAEPVGAAIRQCDFRAALERQCDRTGSNQRGRDSWRRRSLGFYDSTGALRDMVQSHVLQLLCLVAMEPPAGFTPSAVRNEKVKGAVVPRPITAENVATHTVRGQYASSFSGGEAAPSYAHEAGATASDTETFVAIKVEVDNWRWAGVPFYLRTGKRMQRRSSEIMIQFKPAPLTTSLRASVPRLHPMHCSSSCSRRNDHLDTHAQATRHERGETIRSGVESLGLGRVWQNRAAASYTNACCSMCCTTTLPCSCAATRSKRPGNGSTASSKAGNPLGKSASRTRRTNGPRRRLRSEQTGILARITEISTLARLPDIVTRQARPCWSFKVCTDKACNGTNAHAMPP